MYGVTTWTLPVRGKRALEWCAARSLSHIHFGSEDLDGLEEPAELAATAADLGIELSGYAVRVLERLGIGDLDAATAALDAALEVVNDLDVPLVYLPSFAESEIRDSSSLERTARLISYGLGRTAAIVASENTIDAGLNHVLFETVGDDRARLLFDTQNPCLAGMSPQVLLRDVAGLLAPAVHIKDGAGGGEGNTPVGDGEAEVVTTVAMLKELGFSGSFILETDYRVVGADRVSDDVETLNAIVPR